MDQSYTICAFTENSPGVLQRITILFTRRKLNIESLTVSETEQKGVSRFTIVVRCERDLVEKVAKQILRLIEVRDVFVAEDSELVYREVAFYQVNAVDDEARFRVAEVARAHAGSVAFNYPKYVIVEKAGGEDEINKLFSALQPYGVTHFVRSGRIALLKEPRSTKVSGEFQSVPLNFYARPD